MVSLYHKVNSHEELAGEEAARAEIPMVMPKLMGPGAALVHQTTEELNRTIEILRRYLTEDRITRMKDVLDQRTSSTRLLFENPSNPNNVCRSLSKALLRYCPVSMNHARNGETASCQHAARWIDGFAWFHWNHTFELSATVYVSTI